MVTLAIISFVVFALYLIVMAKLHGIQPSISDNYYVSRHRWTFTATMWAVSLCMLPPMLEVTPDPWHFTAFLCCVGVAFVGAAAAFKDELTNKVHTNCALLSVFFGILWISLVNPFVSMAGVGVLVFLLLNCMKNQVYWLEVTCFASVYLSYFFSFLL